MSKGHTGKIRKGKDYISLHVIAYVFCSIIALLCLLPFIMIVTGSLSSEQTIIENGFALWI